MKQHQHPGIAAIRRCLENPISVEPYSPSSDDDSGAKIPAEVSQMSRESQLSQQPQALKSAFIQPGWSDLDIELFEERAAILEFDQGLPRRLAEYLAAA